MRSAESAGPVNPTVPWTVDEKIQSQPIDNGRNKWKAKRWSAAQRANTASNQIWWCVKHQSTTNCRWKFKSVDSFQSQQFITPDSESESAKIGGNHNGEVQHNGALSYQVSTGSGNKSNKGKECGWWRHRAQLVRADNNTRNCGCLTNNYNNTSATLISIGKARGWFTTLSV